MHITNETTDDAVLQNGAAESRSLHIIVVGAGIGGLMAAIGLRRNGHSVIIFEQSRFANETGAAIHLGPNANGLLRHYDMNPEDFGAVTVRSVADYSAQGTPIKVMDMTEPNKLWQYPWQLSHRVRLHETLKRKAVSTTGLGPPAQLQLSSRIASVDVQQASVTLEDGNIFSADLVIGADGIRSRTRKAVVGHDGKFLTSGKAAFRFLVPREKALSVAKSAILEDLDRMSIWFADDRRIVMYPCNDNELLNFVCIHPEAESQGSAEEWSKDASIEQVLKVYESFDPRVLDIIRTADPQSIKVWKLMDMEVLPTWINGKACLLGDAAHPFLPHQGQGGGVALEDAVALATVLSANSKPEEVPDRLRLYEEIRLERANAIQEFSRQAGADYVDGKPQIDMMKYVAYNFGHDEFDNSMQKVENWEHKRQTATHQRMPIGFGLIPSHRENIQASQVTDDHRYVTATIKFRTSRTFLQTLFPTEVFRFQAPFTVAFASLKSTSLSSSSWPANRKYHSLSLYLHGVMYKKRDGSVVSGTYVPIVFENVVDQVLSSRDDSGMPSVYSELDVQQDESSYQMQASWEGFKFGNLTIKNLQLATEEQTPSKSDGTILAYRYIPTVGESGQADSQYAVAAQDNSLREASNMDGRRVSKDAAFSFQSLDVEKLRALHPIVSKLSRIPIYGIVEATVVEGRGRPEIVSAGRIE